MDVKEWAEKVEAFLEENQELADDPGASSNVLGRIIVQGEPITTELSEEIQALTPEVVDAAAACEAAILDSSVSPKELQKLELVHKELKAEWDEINEPFTRLVDFMNKVQSRYHAELDEDLEAMRAFDEDTAFLKSGEGHLLPMSEARWEIEEERESKPSFWKKLFW